MFNSFEFALDPKLDNQFSISHNSLINKINCEERNFIKNGLQARQKKTAVGVGCVETRNKGRVRVGKIGSRKSMVLERDIGVGKQKRNQCRIAGQR